MPPPPKTSSRNVYLTMLMLLALCSGAIMADSSPGEEDHSVLSNNTQEKRCLTRHQRCQFRMNECCTALALNCFISFVPFGFLCQTCIPSGQSCNRYIPTVIAGSCCANNVCIDMGEGDGPKCIPYSK